MANRTRASLSFIFITLMLDVLGIGLIIPVAPKLVQKLMGDVTESQAALAVGALPAVYAAMQFVFAPILGSLSDRVGRRPVILLSLLGSGIDYFIAAIAPNVTVLFITRALNGISGANISACGAYIADVTPPEKRAAGFGLIGAAFGLGFVFGPLAGGVLGGVDVRLPFVAAGVLTLLNVLYGYFVLPESLPPERRRAFSWAKANPAGALAWLTTHPVVLMLAAAHFLISVAQFGLHATWVLSMGMRFNWGPRQVGWSLFVVGIGAAVVQGGLARKIIPALGERACVIAGGIIQIAAFIGYALAPEGWMIYAIVAVASLGGVAQPALQGIVSKAVPPTEQGLLQGALGGLASVAGVLGPLIGAGVFRWFTRDEAPVTLAGAPFLSSAIIAAFALVPIMAIWRRMPTRVSQKPDESPLDPDPDPGSGAPAAPVREDVLTPDSR